jgi:DNA methylase
MGSGTTGMAAINLNRRFIGIEVDLDRFAVVRNRIAGAEHGTITILVEENKAQQPISIFRVFACMCRKPVAYFKLTIPTLKKKVKHVKYSELYYTILIIINYSIIIINYSIIRRFLVVGRDPVRGIP